MSELTNRESRSLILLGSSHSFLNDISQIKNAMDFSKTAGHDVVVDSLWVNESTAENTTIPGTEISAVNTGIITEANALTAADIEATRFETLPEELLSARERRLKPHYIDIAIGQSPEEARREYSELLQKVGAIAVVAGRNASLEVTAGYYEEFRSFFKK